LEYKVAIDIFYILQQINSDDECRVNATIVTELQNKLKSLDEEFAAVNYDYLLFLDWKQKVLNFGADVTKLQKNMKIVNSKLKD